MAVTLALTLIGRGPDVVTVVTPVETTDRYGAQVLDYGDDATRRPARGWLQRTTTTADLDRPERAAGREGEWRFYTHSTVGSTDRIEHDGRTFLVDGQVYPAASTAGVHHHEVPLRLVEG